VLAFKTTYATTSASDGDGFSTILAVEEIFLNLTSQRFRVFVASQTTQTISDGFHMAEPEPHRSKWMEAAQIEISAFGRQALFGKKFPQPTQR
jgi:hypothetical protein